MRLLTDIRYALRTFRREPTFVAGIVLTFGLVIGTNAAMFGLVRRLMLALTMARCALFGAGILKRACPIFRDGYASQSGIEPRIDARVAKVNRLRQ